MGNQHSPSSRNYKQPFNWWGYRSAPQQPLSIIELIEHGTIDDQVAAFLWVAMEHHASLIVAATPQEAGKTTMLTALLDFLPADTETIYLRGWYERFEFLEDQRDPARTYVLSNEISSHLPIYMWGRGVRRMFEAAGDGYAIAATVHASSADEVLTMLANYPLEVPDALLTSLDLVLTLSYRPGVRNPVRQVMSLEIIESDSGKPVPRTLASRDVLGTELRSSPGLLINALVRSFGLEREYATNELARRVAILRRLVRSKTFAPEEIRRAIEKFRNSPPAARP